MATATIRELAVKVDTDLGTDSDPESSLDTVSATDATEVFHRISPYFYRFTELTEKLRVEFSCKHAANSVAYGDVSPPAHTWTGKVVVDETRKSSDVEAATARPITVTEAPSKTVKRHIVCTFEILKRYNSRTQKWETLPPAQKPAPDTLVEFELTP